jgi:hypothetical protein
MRLPPLFLWIAVCAPDRFIRGYKLRPLPGIGKWNEPGGEIAKRIAGRGAISRTPRLRDSMPDGVAPHAVSCRALFRKKNFDDGRAGGYQSS